MMFRGPFGGPGGETQQAESATMVQVTAAADSRTNTVVVTGPEAVLNVVAGVDSQARLTDRQRGRREGVPPPVRRRHGHLRADQRGVRTTEQLVVVPLLAQQPAEPAGPIWHGRPGRDGWHDGRDDGWADGPKQRQRRRQHLGRDGDRLGRLANELRRGQRSRRRRWRSSRRSSSNWMRTPSRNDASSSTLSRTPTRRTS